MSSQCGGGKRKRRSRSRSSSSRKIKCPPGMVQHRGSDTCSPKISHGKLFDLRAGELTKFGYHTHEPDWLRHEALTKSVTKVGYGTTVKRLNALKILNKNQNPDLFQKLRNDLDFVQRHLSGYSKASKSASKSASRSRSRSSSPRRRRASRRSKSRSKSRSRSRKSHSGGGAAPLKYMYRTDLNNLFERPKSGKRRSSSRSRRSSRRRSSPRIGPARVPKRMRTTKSFDSEFKSSDPSKLMGNNFLY